MDTKYTEEQVLYMVYDHLLSNAEEVKFDPALAEFSIDVEKQLRDFEEEYPEIVSEYLFNKKQS